MKDPLDELDEKLSDLSTAGLRLDALIILMQYSIQCLMKPPQRREWCVAIKWLEGVDPVDLKSLLYGDARGFERRLKRLMPDTMATNNRPAHSIEARQATNQDNAGFVYFLRADNGLTKIGKSISPEERIWKQISPKLPYELDVLHHIWAEDYNEAEKWWHSCYANQRVNGEWFELSDEDIEYIRSWRDMHLPYPD